MPNLLSESWNRRPHLIFSEIQIGWCCTHQRLLPLVAETLGQSEHCGGIKNVDTIFPHS